MNKDLFFLGHKHPRETTTENMAKQDITNQRKEPLTVSSKIQNAAKETITTQTAPKYHYVEREIKVKGQDNFVRSEEKTVLR